MSTDTLERIGLTVADYHRLIARGAFGDLRVELLDGRIEPMSPMNPAHASALTRLAHLFGVAFDPAAAAVRQQCPVSLENTWEPHPDMVIAKPGEWDRVHPGAADIQLIVEVSDTTLRDDLGRKVPRYAANGVPEVWIVSLSDRVVHVYRAPDRAGRYLVNFAVPAGGELVIEAFPALVFEAAKIFPA